MSEFQLTLMNYLARQGMSLSELAKRVGYDPLLFEKIVLGKDRQIPVNFLFELPMSLASPQEKRISSNVRGLLAWIGGTGLKATRISRERPQSGRQGRRGSHRAPALSPGRPYGSEPGLSLYSPSCREDLSVSKNPSCPFVSPVQRQRPMGPSS